MLLTDRDHVFRPAPRSLTIHADCLDELVEVDGVPVYDGVYAILFDAPSGPRNIGDVEVCAIIDLHPYGEPSAVARDAWLAQVGMTRIAEGTVEEDVYAVLFDNGERGPVGSFFETRARARRLAYQYAEQLLLAEPQN